MVRLIPQAAALVRVAQQGDEPSAADMSRVRGDLARKLGVGAATTIAATTVSISAASVTKATSGMGFVLGATKAVAVVSVVAAMGVGIRVATTSANGASLECSVIPVGSVLLPTAPSNEQAHGQRAAPDPVEETPGIFPEMLPAVGTGSQHTEPKGLSAKAVSHGQTNLAGDLERELAILRTAHEALRKGDTAQAISMLGEQERGVASPMAEERAALGVLALCRAGRLEEGGKEARRFLGLWPSSPQASRIRNACLGMVAESEK